MLIYSAKKNIDVYRYITKKEFKFKTSINRLKKSNYFEKCIMLCRKW